MVPFNETLRLWRLERRLSQMELAHRTGIARPNVAAIEAGRRDVSLAMLRRLAAALDVTPGTLADGTPPSPAQSLATDRATLERVADAAVDRSLVVSSGEREIADLLNILTASRRAAREGRALSHRSSPRASARAWVRLQSLVPASVLDSLIQRTVERTTPR